MDSEKIAYCAGYFDGEGCITVLYSGAESLSIRIEVQSGDYSTLRFLGGTLGGEVRLARKTKTGLQLYRWMRTGKNAVESLFALTPFLKAKKMEAQLVLDAGWDFSAEFKKRNKKISQDEVNKRVTLRNNLKLAKKEHRHESLSY